MTVVYTLSEYLATFIEGFTVLYAARHLSRKDRSAGRSALIALCASAVYLALISALNAWRVFSFVTVASAVVYTVAATKLMTGTKINVCITSTVLSWFFMNAVDYILLFPFLMATGHSLDVTKGFEYILEPTPYRLLFLFTDKALQILLFALLGRNLKNLSKLGDRYINILLVLSVGAYTVMNVLTGLIAADSFLKIQIAVIFSFIFVVIALVAMIFGIIISSKYRDVRREKELLYLTNKLSEQNYRQLGEAQLRISRQLHDFKNHLIAIDSLTEPDTPANNYIRDLLKSSYESAGLCRSGCEVIDALIDNKAAVAAEQDIDLRFTVRLDGDVGINPADICAVLSNQLDNALEACAKLPDPRDRRVDVEISQKGSVVFFKVSNTVEEDPFGTGGKLTTSKKDDGRIHGMGVRIITETCERYNGSLKNSYENGVFTSSAMMIKPD